MRLQGHIGEVVHVSLEGVRREVVQRGDARLDPNRPTRPVSPFACAERSGFASDWYVTRSIRPLIRRRGPVARPASRSISSSVTASMYPRPITGGPTRIDTFTPSVSGGKRGVSAPAVTNGRTVSP